MSNLTTKPLGSARERIMNVASELFYNQGYRATGINEVIQKSGVAKATFYNHFPTKDDLARAYLTLRREEEEAYVESCIAKAGTPRERFLSIMESVGPWLIATDFRGCVFMNMASEVPDHTSPLRNEGENIYSSVRDRVTGLSRDLIHSDQTRYGHLDVTELTNEYMLIFAGAIALAEIYHAIWPFEHAVQTLRRLIGE
ncbi:MAG: TetR/AcrR family transcriptional regulator [Gammaproteobacteria bacterium]|nr:MAG: TetR/AcrR family transcriptional regulator [Gammaproteobacteria bacterium]